VHKFAVEFTNDYYDEMLMADRNLLVDWFSVEGPQDLISRRERAAHAHHDLRPRGRRRGRSAAAQILAAPSLAGPGGARPATPRSTPVPVHQPT
jgi:hypothetical protein